MGFDGPFGDSERMRNLTIGLSLCNEYSYLTLTLGESAKSSFGGAARREELLLGKQRCCLLQEIRAEFGVWDGGGEFLEHFSGGGKGVLRFQITPLSMIQVPEVDSNAPQQWSQAELER